ncbi:hypothetical protein DPMN_007772 [Dreissena polymorpha]|uniref:Uncharacterized protein n=1 Tax=Dreissena polymorpha TaxID=45954 RepID=A0A9D4MXZ1_DREPO|nr:hypothetical protein DPMN_007772 [Dreissena polymorpha]
MKCKQVCFEVAFGSPQLSQPDGSPNRVVPSSPEVAAAIEAAFLSQDLPQSQIRLKSALPLPLTVS